MTYLRNHCSAATGSPDSTRPLETTDEPMPTSPVVGPDWLPDRVARCLRRVPPAVHPQRQPVALLQGAGDDVTVRTVDLDDDGYGGVVMFDLAGVRGHPGIRPHVAPPLGRAHPGLLPGRLGAYLGATADATPGCGGGRDLPGGQDANSAARSPHQLGLSPRGRAFRDAVRSGDPFRSTASDTRTDVRLFEDIYRQFLVQRGVL